MMSLWLAMLYVGCIVLSVPLAIWLGDCGVGLVNQGSYLMATAAFATAIVAVVGCLLGAPVWPFI